LAYIIIFELKQNTELQWNLHSHVKKIKSRKLKVIEILGKVKIIKIAISGNNWNWQLLKIVEWNCHGPHGMEIWENCIFSYGNGN